jgi:hypothetical protein
VIRHWMDLEIGREYELVITRKGGRCVIPPGL